MEEVQLGQYALPVLLTMALGLIYMVAGDLIPRRIKPLIPIGLGVGFSLLALRYAGKPWAFKVVMDYVFYGAMMGAASVGVHQVWKKGWNRGKSNSGRIDIGLVLLICLISGAFLLSGCSYGLKVNAKRAQEIKEQTVVIMDTIQDMLISWPTYSGWIRTWMEQYKDVIPIPPGFPEAMDGLDELAQYCPAVTDPNTPPGEKCDFSGWQPTILLSDVTTKIRVVTRGWGEAGFYSEFGPTIIYEGKKRTEFGTGVAAGDYSIMATGIVLETLKLWKKKIPEVTKLIKYLSVLL